MKIDTKLKLIIFSFCRITAVILIVLLVGCSAEVSRNIHLKYGNPSQANTNNQNNYLIKKTGYNFFSAMPKQIQKKIEKTKYAILN